MKHALFIKQEDMTMECNALTSLFAEIVILINHALFLTNTKFTIVEQFAHFSGEEAMMQEIYQRGPIACGIAVTQEMENYTSGIFEDRTGDLDVVHEISIVGFGEENGTHWGLDGFMKIVRGKNNMAIESDCAWAVPRDTWSNPVIHTATDDEKNDPNNDFTNGDYPSTSETH
jgi:hypothetical protein